MKTKKECLDYLNKVEQTIKASYWERRVEESSSLLSGMDMLGYCASFNLPVAEYVSDNLVILPVDWMENEDCETSTDYKEVAQKYLEVYNLLRYEASREFEGIELEEKQHNIDLHKNYWRAVL
jgi:hypothetical protein